ncbi:MAG: ABC transporter ATP-binding protein, partial [Desulfuromonadaceae bacterium]
LEDLQHRGMSMLYTTHYMEEAQQLCSRVAVMDRGRVIAQGEPERLVQSNQCRDLEQVFLHLTGRELRD